MLYSYTGQRKINDRRFPFPAWDKRKFRGHRTTRHHFHVNVRYRHPSVIRDDPLYLGSQDVSAPLPIPMYWMTMVVSDCLPFIIIDHSNHSYEHTQSDKPNKHTYERSIEGLVIQFYMLYSYTTQRKINDRSMMEEISNSMDRHTDLMYWCY